MEIGIFAYWILSNHYVKKHLAVQKKQVPMICLGDHPRVSHAKGKRTAKVLHFFELCNTNHKDFFALSLQPFNHQLQKKHNLSIVPEICETSHIFYQSISCNGYR